MGAKKKAEIGKQKARFKSNRICGIAGAKMGEAEPASHRLGTFRLALVPRIAFSLAR